MRKRIVRALVAANIVAAMFVAWNSIPSGSADDGLRRSDLEYGRIDVDGDGMYTKGDDWFVQFSLENFPEHIDAALKTAKRRMDGGVDLSTYLQSVAEAAFMNTRGGDQRK